MEALSAKPKLRVLLDHLATIKDTRQSWKVAYRLQEVLFLVVCGTIASCDDYDDIVDWGEAHLSFLRGFAEFYHGIPCADWLRTVMNRIDPDLFAACFSSWVAECWPDRPDLVAIDGKTSRRSHDRKRGQKALHLVSAFATSSRLVLGQEAVDEKSNEITAIPALLERIDVKGALVSIDARDAIRTSPRAFSMPKLTTCWRSRTTSRRFTPTSKAISTQHLPARSNAPRPSARSTAGSKSERTPSPIASIGLLPSAPIRVHPAFQSSLPLPWSRAGSSAARALSAAAFAHAVRSHWAIENNLHWTLDVTFNEDQSRLRAGHGAKNMAVVRHFALNLVRQATDKRSIKRRRKRASWDPEYLLQILGPLRC